MPETLFDVLGLRDPETTSFRLFLFQRYGFAAKNMKDIRKDHPFRIDTWNSEFGSPYKCYLFVRVPDFDAPAFILSGQDVPYKEAMVALIRQHGGRVTEGPMGLSFEIALDARKARDLSFIRKMEELVPSAKADLKNSTDKCLKKLCSVEHAAFKRFIQVLKDFNELCDG